ncbi:Ig-like domain-containing protein [Paraglaciecola sp. L3A3]|uniref:Ig-like domain-containing protein n=1 Tax=Paraglaciecola sp. L3A3 TaxID=2686358 RepID=UPI00131E4648|nr:Ig-like domain-containing protein [Paraglaciecola sp. L3A3]
MLKAIPWLLVTVGLASTPFTTIAKTETVVNLNVKHSVGGKSKFERSKHIKLHSTIYDNDWNGEEDKLKYMMEDLDVYFGRDNGGSVWNFNQAKEDENRLGYADSTDLALRGKQNRETAYGVNKASVHKYDERGDLMVGGQPKQHFLGKTSPCCGSGEGWQANGGDAVGEFLGQYVNEFFRADGLTGAEGHPRPKYLEILNEPLYQVTDAPHELGLEEPIDPIRVFEFHNDAAEGVRKYNTDVKIGGFTVAFPIFEERNFARWQERMKLFIDTSGVYMDVYSTHFYDLEDSNRFKGSRIEATLDMIDHYSMIKLGHTKEHLISEYGGRNRPMEKAPWTPLRDWWFLKTASPMLLQFLDRPDSVETSIPFVPIKALWGTVDDIPYNWRLLRQAKEGAGEEGDDWVFTEMVKFYELWSDVKGTRVDSFSTNEDILIDSYVDQDKAYVIISNLTEQTEKVLLHKYGSANASIQSVKIKHLYLDGDKPNLEVINADVDVDSFDLAPEATIIVEYTYSTDIKIDALSEEKKYFATEYFKEIRQDIANTFEINNVLTNEHGEAILRIAVGRDHGLSLSPSVSVNGQLLSSEVMITGDDQLGRDRFFGLLEIPIPNELLKSSNQVSITFPDNGGHITSVNMKVFNFSEDLRPAGGAVAGMFISSEANIVAVGETLQVSASVTPFFATDQTFSLASSDDGIAIVTPEGVVTGIKAGVVDITATSTDGGFSAKISITVEEPVAASLVFDDVSKYTSTVFKVGGVMQVTTHYEAGTGEIISNQLGGVSYFLRHMNSNWTVRSDIKVLDASAIGKQRGTSTVDIPLDGLTPSDELLNGEFYFLFIRFHSSAEVTKSVQLAHIQIEQDEVVIKPGLQLDDDNKYKSTVYTNDATLDVVANFEAGGGQTVTNEMGGVTFFLREMDQTWLTTFGDVVVADATAVGEQSGTANVSIPLIGLTPTADLPEGHFYFLYAQFQSSDGTTYNIPGVAPINIEHGVVTASFTLDDVNKYQATNYEVGSTMDITANYEMGTGNTVGTKFNGIRYFLRHIKKGWAGIVKDVVAEDASVIGIQSGVSNVSIPLTGVTPSADLPEGDFYFLFVIVQSSDGSEYNIPVSGINILPGASVKGDWDGDGDVDYDDVRAMTSAVQSRQDIDMAFDLSEDGVVNVLDVRAMMAVCTRSRCAVE